ncbi:MAG: hypothetical protein H0V07_00215 [Propionibacteriales bacterium]|nr:hypothetical protein [Propionibacteriales bacterium]
MRTRFARFGLAALGAGALVYGGWLTWGLGAGSWLALAKWLAGGVIAHDLLLAPIVVVLGVVTVRLVPAYARAPVAVAAIIWGTLTVVAIPVLGGFGADPTLPSLLDRPYLSSWLILTALMVVGVAAASLVRRRAATSPRGAPQRRERGRAG